MLLGLLFFIPAGLVRFLSLFGVRPFGLLLGYRLWIKVGGLSLLRFKRFGMCMMRGCSFMSREDAFRLDEALLLGDVSSAWMVLVFCC